MSNVKDDYEKGYAAGRKGDDRAPSIIENLLDQLIPGPSIFEKSTAYKEGCKQGREDTKKK